MSSQVFITSDLHLGHANLREFRNEVHNKSFSETSDVDQWLLAQWNSVVRHKDIVWVLGDVAWSKSDLEWLALMNGHKKLVLGNHDAEGRGMSIDDYLPYFESVHGCIKKYGLVMTHVPIHPQELAFRWTTNVHGHIHHMDRCLPKPNYINVNVDVRGGFPVKLDDIREEIRLSSPQGS